ncbi:3'(2'),5'-bisphosphate nucleotidase CysQ [Leptospira perolatii]|uniref:3'(2'),5'-bisphosphate nucleotidase CysQ n=1 Tax=Leptospira perolatii TaxID=2023191 RepID=A0A2M9ZMQ2_9LEPT|nr:3'(2'),5'-bisphosphate nucleotidase CysQ [Leptospira perolatii]PJZ70149.1 3'(2'),5'-bisphosphate nucleotidase CysQ [Leptospira perolatii]PJZ73338.1 3'(2'),5'-bisphosphate nucleotidase CysQ [Leptospira perolatii]
MVFPDEADRVSELVLKAADEILKIYRTDFPVYEKKKGDPVTEADLLANRIIVQGIQSIWGDPVRSEEDAASHSAKLDFHKRIWILDPIDGTREFVSKNPEFALSLGLVEDGRPIFGIVMNPANGEFFWGKDGVGAGFEILSPPFQGQKIQWSQSKKFLEEESYTSSENHSKILISKSEERQGLFRNASYSEKFTLKTTGSIAYKLALVGVGKFPLVLSLRPKNDWDIAGGIAIIRASGGFDLELKTELPYTFPSAEKGIGLLAGHKNTLEKFHELYGKEVSKSVKYSWD